MNWCYYSNPAWAKVIHIYKLISSGLLIFPKGIKVSQWTPAPRFEGFITRSFLTAVGLWSQQDICWLTIKHLNFKIILSSEYWSSLEKNVGKICTHKPLKIWEDIKKSTLYLCSGSRPKGRRNSGLRCTPACCWYTCYCGKRKYLPHRELMRGKNG